VKKIWDISAEEHKKLNALTAFFLKENEKINLSAIRDKEGVWEKHIVDSLAAVPIIRERSTTPPVKILDFGSGGGFPALPLAAVFPEKQFFPLDSVAKKMRAVQEIAKKCGMRNVNVLVGRGEDLAKQKEYREQFDIVVSRAAAPWAILLEIATPFVKKNGIFIAYRGPEHETSDIPLAKKMGLSLEKIEKYTLKSGEKRELWILKKKKHTEKRFPRKVGIPKKKPLTIDFF